MGFANYIPGYGPVERPTGAIMVLPGFGLIVGGILPADALLIVDLEVIAARIVEERAELVLGALADMRKSAPRELFSRLRCKWRFKGPECGYTGIGATCEKTIMACYSYGNVGRFGAFPAIPGASLSG